LTQLAKRLIKNDGAKQELARRYLADFLEYESGWNNDLKRYNWMRAKHLQLLCEKIEAIERGDLRKLMVFMPPRHGKSEVVSKKFPAWYLGRNPNNEIILSSYSADLAYDFSEIARNTIRSVGYLFGKELSSESSAKKKWKLSKYRGGLSAAGVRGPITGRGAHVAIIDDPFKNWEEASSSRIRDKVDTWYQSVLRTRLSPKGAVILVMTRWHEDDLAGRLLQREGDEWELIQFPALATENDILGRKPGEVLWPRRYNKEEILDIKRGMLSRLFDSLYQQIPRKNAEDALWSYDMIRRINNAPDLEQIVVAIDPQGKKSSSNNKTDDTGIVIAGRSADKHYYVLDDRTINASPNGWARKAVSGYYKFEADRIVGEVNNGGDMVESVLRTIDSDIPYSEVRATRGKMLRAEPIAALYEQGKVFHVGDNFDELEDELTSWSPDKGLDSPNRLDALVWALTKLKSDVSGQILIGRV